MKNTQTPMADARAAWLRYLSAKSAFTEKHSALAPDRNEAGGKVYMATKDLEAALSELFGAKPTQDTLL